MSANARKGKPDSEESGATLMAEAVQKPTAAYAIVRIRGTVNVNGKIQDTMRMLRVQVPNHCAIVPADETSKGMVRKVQDYVAYGEVDAATVAELLRTRGRLVGDRPVTDDSVREASAGKWDGIDAFAAALAKGEASLGDLEGLKPLFRLHPPRGGHGTIKRHVTTGGPLGYHGPKINDLIRRML